MIKFQGSKHNEISSVARDVTCKENNGDESKNTKQQENMGLKGKSAPSGTHGKESCNRRMYADQKFGYECHNSVNYPSRNQPRTRYDTFFNGYCFCCSNFGHRAASCGFNFRNVQRRMSNYT